MRSEGTQTSPSACVSLPLSLRCCESLRSASNHSGSCHLGGGGGGGGMEEEEEEAEEGEAGDSPSEFWGRKRVGSRVESLLGLLGFSFSAGRRSSGN